MDDILVKGKTVQDLAENCPQGFCLCLKAANLCFNPKKIRIGFRQLVYLGHVISEKGISPNPAKIQGIRGFPVPLTARTFKKFLGMVSYYRKFIPRLGRTFSSFGAVGELPRPGIGLRLKNLHFQSCKEIRSNEALLQLPRLFAPRLYPNGRLFDWSRCSLVAASKGYRKTHLV